MNTEEEKEKEAAKSKPRFNIPEGALVILPIRNRVLFPSMMMPLTVRGPARRQAVEEAVRQQVPIGIVVQRDPNIEDPKPQDLYEVGTAADVARMFTLPDGRRQILVQGRRRFEIAEFLETDPVLIARVTIGGRKDTADQGIRGKNLTSASRSGQSLIVIARTHERNESDD